MPNTPHDYNEQKTQVQDYFSRTAESYVSSFSHKSGDDLERLIELGEWDGRQQALDIATGGGHTALAGGPHVAPGKINELPPPHFGKKAGKFTPPAPPKDRVVL